MPDSGIELSDQTMTLIAELVARDVPFMVVGMGAAILQGADTVTKDIDLWFKSTSHPGVAAAAQAAGGAFVWRSNPPTFSGRGLDDVDVVFHCHGLEAFDNEYANAVEVPFVEGFTIKVLPIERVVASKRAAGRPKDKAAMPALEAAVAAIKHRRGRP
jgi:hypothetical protein